MGLIFTNCQSNNLSSPKAPDVRVPIAPYNSSTILPPDSDLLVISLSATESPSVRPPFTPAAPLTSPTFPITIDFAGTASSIPSLPSNGIDSKKTESLKPSAGATSYSSYPAISSSSGRSLWLTSARALEGKFVGLFFGADWCPYCKTFMVPLIKFYNFLGPSSLFEVVYVPCDRNMREYQSFVKTMPWYALPLRNYGDLIRKYKVKSLPSLVLVTPDDAVLAKNAVELVKEKGSAEKFKSIFERFKGPITIGNRFRSLFG